MGNIFLFLPLGQEVALHNNVFCQLMLSCDIMSCFDIIFEGSQKF